MDDTGALDVLLNEVRVFRPLPQTIIEANVKPQELAGAYRTAQENPLAYWEDAALELEWFRRWDRVLDDDNPPHYRWFPGGQCNIVYNALDRHIRTVNRNKLALIWEGEPGDSRKFTYFELYRAVNRFAGALRSLGVRKGDRVAIYMPLLPETLIAMLATAKIGAIHVCVFGGFSAKVLRERICDSQAKVLVTADGFYRNGRVINQKAVVDEALTDACADCVDTVVVVHRAGVDVEMVSARDIWYADLVRNEFPETPTEVMEATDPLFLLHTSGTSGRSKAVVHTHGGYMVGVARSMNWVFDIKPTDIFWCTADSGWITGHSYVVYAPLLCGTTTLMYEGHPLYPQADRMWSMVARYGVTAFYTTPTLIRMLMRYGSHFPKQHDLSSIRMLGSVGEPLSPEVWVWFHRHIGRGECPLLDTWWQTETGTLMIAPLPVSALKPGSVGKPLPGVAAEVVDREGAPVPPGKGGFLVLTRPWPGMFQGLWNNPESYADTYWRKIPGVYVTGDVARKDEDGYYWIQGRTDEAINIAGHNLGTAELEAALMAHKAVAEAAVVGIPDKIKGEVVKAFVILPEGHEPSEDLVRDLKTHLRRELGPVAVLKSVAFVESLPRNKAGKLLRRVLRAQELGLDPGDLSSLDLDEE